jgi:hypothetical protein
VSDPDAYPDDMGRFYGMSEEDIERLVGGAAPADDEELEQLAGFLAVAKEELTRGPAQATEHAHLVSITETARSLAEKGEPVARPASKATGPAPQASGLPTWRRVLLGNRATRLIAKVTAAAVALTVLTGGLALAGVDLPNQVEDAFDRAGIELPNQVGSDEELEGTTAEQIDDLQSSNAPGWVKQMVELIKTLEGREGCEFGQMIAGVASSSGESTEGPSPEACTAGEEGRELGEQKASEGRELGEQKSAEGRQTGSDASEQGRQTGSDASEQGRQTGSDASEQGRQIGSDASEQGQQTGSDASDQGQQTGQDQSESGQSQQP